MGTSVIQHRSAGHYNKKGLWLASVLDNITLEWEIVTDHSSLVLVCRTQE